MEFKWMLEEDLLVRTFGLEIGEPRFLVTDTGRRWAAMISWSEDRERILLNGESAGLGRYFPFFLGLMDEAVELAAKGTSSEEEVLLPVESL